MVRNIYVREIGCVSHESLPSVCLNWELNPLRRTTPKQLSHTDHGQNIIILNKGTIKPRISATVLHSLPLSPGPRVSKRRNE